MRITTIVAFITGMAVVSGAWWMVERQRVWDQIAEHHLRIEDDDREYQRKYNPANIFEAEEAVKKARQAEARAFAERFNAESRLKRFKSNHWGEDHERDIPHRRRDSVNR